MKRGSGSSPRQLRPSTACWLVSLLVLVGVSATLGEPTFSNPAPPTALSHRPTAALLHPPTPHTLNPNQPQPPTHTTPPAGFPSGPPGAPIPAPQAPQNNRDAVFAAIRRGEPQELLVTFKRADADTNAQVKARVFAPTTAVSKRGVKVVTDFNSLPISLVTVGSGAALDALLADPNVQSLSPNGVVYTMNPGSTGGSAGVGGAATAGGMRMGGMGMPSTQTSTGSGSGSAGVGGGSTGGGMRMGGMGMPVAAPQVQAKPAAAATGAAATKGV